MARLLEICLWKESAEAKKEMLDRKQKPKYVKISLHDCLECDGFNFKCEKYASIKVEETARSYS